jgi:mannosyl-3-phosphoglycerate phosphatase
VSKRSATKIIGFGDMTVEEIANDCGLPPKLARLAKRRLYDEPFRIIAGSEKEVLNLIIKEGFNYTKGGRYFHIMGKTDKGTAVTLLKDLYAKRFSKLVTYGVGDSPNDLSMLEVVDMPMCIREIDGRTKGCNVWEEVLNQVREATSPQNNRV